MHHHRTGFNTIILLLAAALACGCRPAGKPATAVRATPATPPPATVQPLQPQLLVAVDSLRFRRNYHNFGEMNDWEYKRFCNRDPDLMDSITPRLEQQLTKAGMMRQGGLRLRPFRLDGDLADDYALIKLRLQSKSGSRATVRAGFRKIGTDYIIHVNNGRQADSLVLPFAVQQFRLLKADIVPGGFPELVLMRRWYIANGDNYDINIYEIREQ